MRLRESPLAAGVLILVAANALAADRSVGIKDISVISDGQGRGRVLFRLDEPGRFDNITVRSAILQVPFAAIEGDRILDLVIYPVTTEWERGGVEWELGWDTPGGDFDERLPSRTRAEIRGGPGHLVFDLTVPIKEVFEGDIVADGFLVTADAEGGIAAEDLVLLDDLGSAHVDVSYRVMTGFPPRSERSRRD